MSDHPGDRIRIDHEGEAVTLRYVNSSAHRHFYREVSPCAEHVWTHTEGEWDCNEAHRAQRLGRDRRTPADDALDKLCGSLSVCRKALARAKVYGTSNGFVIFVDVWGTAVTLLGRADAGGGVTAGSEFCRATGWSPSIRTGGRREDNTLHWTASRRGLTPRLIQQAAVITRAGWAEDRKNQRFC